jgi:hypothetical protein
VQAFLFCGNTPVGGGIAVEQVVPKPREISFPALNKENLYKSS